MTQDLHELLDSLNEPQRRAATHVDGPLLIVAGPGSGKTRTVTARMAHLVRGVGVAPWNVLAITFTNKAAAEMRQRVAQLVTEKQARAMTVATFHALCVRILKRYAEQIGFTEGFSVADDTDQQRLIKQVIADLDLSTSNFPPAKVLATISHAKNELQDPRAFEAQASDFYHKRVAALYTAYQRKLAASNTMDFDDLLMRTVDLMRTSEQALAELRERYQYVLVDEYQDTNHAQFTLAKLLAHQHRNLCVTGDPDQSIYAWRGADIRNILEFERDFPDATTVALEQNYRSTRHILDAADRLIQHNRQRKAKRLLTDHEAGEPVAIVGHADERAEARAAVDWLRRLRQDEGLAWSQMALCYRVNSLSRVIEDALREGGVPYQVARGTAFYDRREVRDALAYLRVIANPLDEASLLRIINTPARGISDKTQKSLRSTAAAENMPLAQMLRHALRDPTLTPRAAACCTEFARQLEDWITLAQTRDGSLRAFVERVLTDSGLHAMVLKDKADPDEERVLNLGELVSDAQQFEDQTLPLLSEQDMSAATVMDRLRLFLEHVALMSDADTIDATQGAVTLMTLHAAKGLEFAAVAILAVEDGLLPHERSRDNPAQLEEERRLMFVGVTRAKRFLLLSHARRRTLFGQSQATIDSPFLRELAGEGVRASRAQDPVEDDAPAPERELPFRPGERVRHPSFGVGRVLVIQAMATQTRARVEFPSAGVKTLVIEYARLEKVP